MIIASEWKKKFYKIFDVTDYMNFRCPPCVFIKIAYNKDGHYIGEAYTILSDLYKNHS